MQDLKTVIIYYSFSGNTRKIAHAINRGMNKASGKPDIFLIKGTSGVPGLNPEDLLGYDLIGFGSPVWNLHPTPNMMTFIEGLPSLKGKHTFLFFSHGVLPGNSLRWAVKTLKSKHAAVIGWNNWYGSCYPPDMFKPYYTDGHPDDIDLKEAEDFGEEMVERCLMISAGDSNLIPTMPKGKEYNKLYGYRPSSFSNRVQNAYPFEIKKIHWEKCNQCNLCIENCPTGSIDLYRTPPVDKSSCVFCKVCEQICPVGAIEIDYDSIVAENEKNWGKNRQGLSHFKKAIKRVEKDPRFRRLVPLEDIGKDGYWYQISKHPRIKITQE